MLKFRDDVTTARVYFLFFSIIPQKGTKNAVETARTFATIFGDLDFRQRLLESHTPDEFKRLIWEHTKELAEEQSHCDRKQSLVGHGSFEDESEVRNIHVIILTPL